MTRLLRRAPLYHTPVAIALAVVVLAGCDAEQPASAPAPTAPTATRSTASGCPVTPADIEPAAATVTFGPVNGVPASTAGGERLVVVGTVYSTDCRPLDGATLTMYQTDGAGEYGPGHGTAGLRCCYLGGTVRTDADGRFRLVTIRPGHYRGEANSPPAHIHLEVGHPDTATLTSEIVFADDQRVPANADQLGMIVTSPVRQADGWQAVADIVVPSAGTPA